MDQKGFASLVGMLLALVIIFFLGYKAFGVYLNKPSDKKTDEAGQVNNGGGYYSSRMQTFIDTKEKIKDVNKTILERENQFLNATKEGY